MGEGERDARHPVKRWDIEEFSPGPTSRGRPNGGFGKGDQCLFPVPEDDRES
jgi:hypothetical protein